MTLILEKGNSPPDCYRASLSEEEMSGWKGYSVQELSLAFIDSQNLISQMGFPEVIQPNRCSLPAARGLTPWVFTDSKDGDSTATLFDKCLSSSCQVF